MMVCPRCHGPGSIYAGSNGWQPCPECQGCGIVSCCDTAGAEGDSDGLATMAAPDPEKAAGAPSNGQQSPIRRSHVQN